MRYTKLGGSDLIVSRICLGYMGFGDAANGQHSWTVAEELAWLEEPYVPHALVGVMAQNTASAAKQAHVWSTGNQKIKKMEE